MEKITLPLIGYKNYKILEGDYEYLELHDEYLRSFGHHKIEWSGDEDMIPKEREYDFSYIIFKSCIVNIDRTYSYPDECWKVILVTSTGTNIDFIMKSKIAACALADKLLEWKLSKTSPDAS